MLDHPLVQARLHLPADQFQQRPESQVVRSLYDCPEVPVGPDGVLCRVVVATHPAGKKKSPVGATRAGVVYELFFTNLSRASHSPPPMSSNCICIAEPLSLRSPMRIGNILTGVVSAGMHW